MKTPTALSAKFKAQKLVFGPVFFQAIVAMKELGVLEHIRKKRGHATIESIQENCEISEYGAEVLIEAALASDLIEEVGDAFQITKVGVFILMDELTRVNMNFVNDVCYNGAKFTTESIREGRPAGLKVLGDWPTVYEGLSALPEPAKKSWFEFDHYYSDDAFPYAMDIIFQDNPKHIFDIGANTGKWAMACKERNPELAVTLLDLPIQLNVARQKIEEKGLGKNVNYHPIDLLDPFQKIPPGADTIWMSQFLDCFSKAEILQILKNVHQAIDENTNVYILEPFFNNQKYPAAEYCLIATSLYFTTMANGNSKMYSIDVMKKLIDASGLKVVETFELIGDSYHTILKCQKN